MHIHLFIAIIILGVSFTIGYTIGHAIGPKKKLRKPTVDKVHFY